MGVVSDEKHSPGPWRWKAMPGCTELHSAEGDIFCVQEEHNGFFDPRCADARLIAAAPEMLALLRFFDVPDTQPGDSEPYEDRCLMSRGSPLHKRILALIARIDRKAGT